MLFALLEHYTLSHIYDNTVYCYHIYEIYAEYVWQNLTVKYFLG